MTRLTAIQASRILLRKPPQEVIGPSAPLSVMKQPWSAQSEDNRRWWSLESDDKRRHKQVSSWIWTRFNPTQVFCTVISPGFRWCVFFALTLNDPRCGSRFGFSPVALSSAARSGWLRGLKNNGNVVRWEMLQSINNVSSCFSASAFIARKGYNGGQLEKRTDWSDCWLVI